MDGIKLNNLIVSYPKIDHGGQDGDEPHDDQVVLVSEISFESADITAAFEKSGKIEETADFNKKYGESNEAHDREEALIDFISDLERELEVEVQKQLDAKFKEVFKKDETAYYVTTEVDFNLHGSDSKDMHGQCDVKVFLDISMEEIATAMKSVFESMR